ncbi:MAG: 3-deoxy-manno-octulosonate cytidylyltransferase [Spirochaetae bacterium HGW-Spirochaetae-2]|jgi:3-deoxy-manno-octulosonate cytidylyltransferase (CMP-KDO synthetase)|nr:MAG: 3-deoxy-manno-octulosonate cytidylyltransferase [Spirochaetae bacterium HGW-Spirochaetae-2]
MTKKKTILGVIPVRYDSTRLPGKPLCDICGKPMVQRVYEIASLSTLLDDLLVATDDQRVFDAVTAFGGKVVMTSAEHMTGSDRIAEVVRSYHCDYVLNIQGDEPLLIPEIIDEVIIALVTDKKQVMTTSCYRITDQSRIDNPNAVKVVVDIEGNAMLFSRAPIPYPRNREYHAMHEHIGVFGFRKDFLLKYVTLPNTPLSLTESLEQLKAMENGYRIKVVQTKYNYQPPSVKTREDLEQVMRILSSQG